MGFTDNPLYLRTLAPQPGQDLHAEPRERLRSALFKLRERAEVLAGEIQRDLPDFTVHDITHLDALWEMADLIAGPEYPVNPMEAFALGAVFLIHDLGLGLAAYPGGVDELKRGLGWQDALSTHLRKHLGRIPTSEELASPPLEVEHMAIQERLRILHAEHAERLAFASWSDGRGGVEYHLIEDPDLRKAVGHRLGKVAHSHWWPISRLGAEFGTIRGALPNLPHCPPNWTLDPLKIAVLLRTADAAHLDARRAPGFLRTTRRPQATSQDHWLFQELLLKPSIPDDRLIYTSSRAFTSEEVEAWWLCEATLQMVDRELQQVDSLLYDLSRPRLQAKGVAGIESPGRLKNGIEVSGWTPVDARLHVSSVADLVRRLGGEQLYGDDATVPLRELIQNATDAVRARQILNPKGISEGRITVRLGHDEDGPWVEVEDTGVGMSEAVLTGPLLDFGSTYWGSSLMREELEGLWAGGFEPIGQYGIGFFSVFIWGQRVLVTSRRHEDSWRDTRILEFQTGLSARPLLRFAEREEQLQNGGTKVRVWLSKNPEQKGGMLWPPLAGEAVDLRKLCAWLAPALDVDLYVEGEGEITHKAVGASDWLTISDSDLLERLSLDGVPSASTDEPVTLANIISSNGRLVGRASVIHAGVGSFDHPKVVGVIAVGGLRATSHRSFTGIILGSVQKISRDKAEPLDPMALASWASEQACFVEREVGDPGHQMYYAASILAFGGDVGRLPIVRRGSYLIDRESIEFWVDAPRVVILAPLVFKVSPIQNRTAHLSYNVLGACSSMAFQEFGGGQVLVNLVRDSLAGAWRCSSEDIEVGLSSEEYEIGSKTDGSIETAWDVVIFRRPTWPPPAPTGDPGSRPITTAKPRSGSSTTSATPARRG